MLKLSSNLIGVKSIFRVATACILLGFAVIAYVRGLPWRSLVWDQAIFEPIVKCFGIDWSIWVSAVEVEKGLLYCDYGVASIWLLGGLMTIFIDRIPRQLFRYMLSMGAIFLLLHFTLAAKGNFWRIGYILEHSLQVATPYLLLFWYRKNSSSLPLVGVLSVLSAFTFIGHGLFALGVHPLPAHFVLMTTEGLNFLMANEVASTKELFAKFFLSAVGFLDIIAGVFLLLPINKLKNIAMYWVLPWAILTTVARLWAGAQFSSMDNFFTYWIPEFLIRIPHIALPYLLWLELTKKAQR